MDTMSISNPSHLLISRNPPRSPAHPQLAPTLTASLQPTIYPPVNGPWHKSTHSEDTAAGPSSATSTEQDGEDVTVHPTFHRDSALPGRVKVLVGKYEFWCHKEVLWFASPFFQALLQGSWAETNPESSNALSRRSSWTTTSPTDTDLPTLVQVPETQEDLVSELSRRIGDTTIEEDEDDNDNDNDNESDKKTSVYMDAHEDGPSVAEILRELREIPDAPNLDTEGASSQMALASGSAPVTSPTSSTPLLLQPSSSQPLPPTVTTLHSPAPPHQMLNRRSGVRHSFSSAIRVSARGGESDSRGVRAEAVVELHEESAAAFQDFLFWCYPHLECKVTWTNVENLLALSLKLLTPALQRLCEHFLMTHASGRPVMALMLAEQHGNADLYREASRFVLDQPTWEKGEMDCLDESTQLKLSQRRNWFLERLLKLGTIDVKREYTCRPDCPDPSKCQAQLDEKWRQAHMAVCRYGPPQPSVAFRCLRQLETSPTNRSLVMPHFLCQRAAQSWVMTLFDRMFQPKIVYNSMNPGTEKYWLSISMH